LLLTGVTSSLSDANHPGTLFSAAHYNAGGSLLSATLDGGIINETRTYNGRLRLTSISNTAFSNPVAAVNGSATWLRGEVYAGGRHLATYGGGVGGTTYFNFADWLGTEPSRASVAGTVYETCTSLPFGDWLTCSAPDSSPMHFTGKERDSESGLDNFAKRFFGSSMGRFTSPDPIGIMKQKLVDARARISALQLARPEESARRVATGLRRAEPEENGGPEHRLIPKKWSTSR